MKREDGKEKRGRMKGRGRKVKGKEKILEEGEEGRVQIIFLARLKNDHMVSLRMQKQSN